MKAHGALTAQSIAAAAQTLARQDSSLADVLRQLGPPPTWKRSGTFATLVRIILEQQVSLDSAKATYDRIRAACGGQLRADLLADFSVDQIRALGVTRQKTRYILALRDEVLTGSFSPRRLAYQTDDIVREQITARLGMGDWTADIYLILALMRPDVLPVGDLAFVKGLSEMDCVEYCSAEELHVRAENWRPFRSVAVRMVWQQYVYNRGRKIP
ncbi:DNA-3-methyladenine glycosylase family protein [Stieleria varia]|uniref:DNA-3-methyladenine glycosylase II n=1 Tax=Stieleria varia TaxID=2528005 RepID=A0A5C5ZVI2_9BACT|nr:DNA-3-methyladenine glycosylase [Stieleria varia]TWT91564.1 HhH-GPD superfamily base excision DNA repair protein [Stieleria varia]